MNPFRAAKWCYRRGGVRRITATLLYFKAENWSLDRPEISVYLASIFSTSRISG